MTCPIRVWKEVFKKILYEGRAFDNSVKKREEGNMIRELSIVNVLTLSAAMCWRAQSRLLMLALNDSAVARKVVEKSDEPSRCPPQNPMKQSGREQCLDRNYA